MRSPLTFQTYELQPVSKAGSLSTRFWTPPSTPSEKGKLRCHTENRLCAFLLTRATRLPSSSSSPLPRCLTSWDKRRVTAPRNTGKFREYESGGRQCGRAQGCRSPQPFQLGMQARKRGKKKKVFRQPRLVRSLITITSWTGSTPEGRPAKQMGSYTWKERDGSERER